MAEWLQGTVADRIVRGGICVAALRGGELEGFYLVSFGEVLIPLAAEICISIDTAAIAEGANVSRTAARQIVAMLIRSHLIYPDGQIAKVAKGAMQAAIARQIAPKKKAKPKKEDEGTN